MIRRLLACLLVAAGIALYAAFNPLRLTHAATLSGVLLLGVASRKTRDLVVSFLPLVLFVWIYDLMRLARDRAADVALVGEMYRAERWAVGWMTPTGGDLGPVDLFRHHHHVVLDCLGGLWYSTHMLAIGLFAFWLWWRSQGGDGSEDETVRERSDDTERTRHRLDVFMWGFFAMSALGLAIQAWCPVAPPWYVEQFGMHPPGRPVEGDPAALARVDALLGIGYFERIYAESAYVFGAFPSLHVATPVWLALNVRSRLGRLLAWGFAATMAFFAVYLIHHYVLDVLAGALLAVVVHLLRARTRLGRWPTRWRRHLRFALGGSFEREATS